MKLAFALAVLLAAQQEPFVETIEVRLHNVDVVVTDRAGNPVRSLRVEDFELLEDGKPQKITNFAEYGEEETRTSQPAVAHGTPGAAPSVAAAPAPAAALPPPPRKVVFFVDEMSVHPQSRGRLAKSAAELLDRTLRPGDEAVVIRPTETIALDFSDDVPAVRAALVKAIEENTYRTDIAFAAEMRAFLQEASRAINEKDRRQIARRHAAKVKRRVEKRLAALRGIIATLAPLQGRRIIITLTESLPAQPGKEFFGVQGRLNVTPGAFDTPSDSLNTDYADMTPAIEELARIASSSGITIYGLQPEYDLRISPPGDDASKGGGVVIPIPNTARSQEAITDTSAGQVQQAMTNTSDTMNVLTGRTGGRWFVGEMRIDDAMRTVEQDLRSWYSLAYRAGPGFDKPHRVAVRVRNHPEYTVRARNEVTRRSPKKEMSDRVVAALVTTTIPNELGIAARASVPKKEKGGKYTVDVDVLVRIGSLTLLREGDTYRGTFTVHYAVTGSDADFVSGIEPAQVVEVPAAELADARQRIWRHTLHLEMDSKDRQVAVGILDGISNASGIATLNVEVP